MYRLPSTSTSQAPLPSEKKIGVPPTARNARTGEFTPPGMTRWEASNNCWLRSYMGLGRMVERLGKCPGRRADIRGIEKRGDHRNHVRACVYGLAGILGI